MAQPFSPYFLILPLFSQFFLFSTSLSSDLFIYFLSKHLFILSLVWLLPLGNERRGKVSQVSTEGKIEKRRKEY